MSLRVRPMSGMNGTAAGLNLQPERIGRLLIGSGAGLGKHDGGRLHGNESGRRIGPAALDHGKGTRLAQSLDKIRRRTVGNNNHRTLQGHDSSGWQTNKRTLANRP